MQIDYVSPLLFVEQVEVHLKTKKLLILELLVQVGFLLSNFSISLLQLFLLLLQGSDLFVNLLFHHLVQILLLNI